MSKRKDPFIDRARQIVALTAGLSQEVAVTYVASELRVAHQRGGIEAAKAKTAAKETLV